MESKKQRNEWALYTYLEFRRAEYWSIFFLFFFLAAFGLTHQSRQVATSYERVYLRAN